MSIGFNNMYNITAGIFTCFSNKNSKKRILAVNHPEKKRDLIALSFPSNKYNNSSKENFVIFNLYINFIKSPSSLMSSIEYLKELDTREALKFKNEIINYRKFLNEDIEKIEQEETSINVNTMLTLYRNNKIKWYTFYFYLDALPNSEIEKEKLRKSRINSRLISKIESLLLYVSFSDQSKLGIKKLMIDKINI